MIDTPFQKTPCVGRCSTVYGDPICRGCKRFMNEIAFWNQINLSEKKEIWLRLDRLAQRVVPQFVEIIDQYKLEDFLEHNAIRYPQHLSQESWALHCIENFPFQLENLKDAGLKPHSTDIKLIKELRLQVQKAMYHLSLAEKQRHAQAGL